MRSRTAGYPRVSLGDLLAKVFHDWDNGHGLVLDDGGVLFGDGCLDRGVTKDRAQSACRVGADDIAVAHGLGSTGRHLSGEALFAAVRQARRTDGEAFGAESRIPWPSDENPPQNWQAPDLDSLRESPIVGSTGPTVGEAVSRVLEEGEELPSRLERLGQGIAGTLDVPPVPGLREWLSGKASQADRQGFLYHLVSDPRACVLEIVGGREDGLQERPA